MTTHFRLSEVLTETGISQSELARKSEVSLRTISRMCTNATAQVSLETLDKIASALGVDPGSLIAKAPKRRR